MNAKAMPSARKLLHCVNLLYVLLNINIKKTVRFRSVRHFVTFQIQCRCALSASDCFNLSIHLSIYLSIYLSMYLPIYLSTYVYVHVYIYVYM